MYFIPASFATFTHALASNLTGLKRAASLSYAFTGTADGGKPLAAVEFSLVFQPVFAYGGS